MASTYSSLLRMELIAAGEQAGLWGNTTNNNLGSLLEQAIAGATFVTLTSTSYTLTAYNATQDESRSMILVFSGSPGGTTTVTVPTASKFYIVKNGSDQSILVKTSGGTGITLAAGVTLPLFCDGTNVLAAVEGAAIDLTADVSGILPVANGGTGVSTSTGTGATVRAVSPAFTGTPTAPTAGAGTNTTQLATTAFVTGAVGSAVPTGSLLMWSTTSAPTGYLMCDGSAVNRTTYAALFAVIGTTFGAGDTTTTFNLPNFQDRMPIGAGNLYNIGSTGGSKDAINVSHTHTYNGTTSTQAAVDVNIGYSSGGGVVDPNITYGVQSVFETNTYVAGTTTDVPAHSHTYSGTTDSSGSSGTNANLPPYIGIRFIIKT